jgi:hypothetical protein
VAARDLKAGDTVLREAALASGPGEVNTVYGTDRGGT